ncbi:lipoprotein [Marinobacterium maritimum]|uniref:Lipoprotein n=2 Tax=Marinobacterium maritimum TaxID=500162 RepID=A0ABN1I7E5_9GAMM
MACVRPSRTLLAITLTTLLLGGCASNGQPRPFQLKNLAKSEIDMVADLHVEAVNKLARELTIKLYKRNPRELAKVPGMTVERRLELLLGTPRLITHAELNNLYAEKAVPLAFDPSFGGDRVFALMVGITGMLHASYSYRNEFFMLNEMDQQKLYNSARNLEAVAWRLNTYRHPDGSPFLLANDPANLSFERLLGKLIAHQDMMARIVSDSTNRTINTVVHGIASTTLLPI